jgi:Tol biopolymer transport system component
LRFPLLKAASVVVLAVTVFPISGARAAPSRTNGKIAFTRQTPDGVAVIAIVNPDGSGNETSLTSGVPGIKGLGGQTNAAWSPDGTRIAYDSVVRSPDTRIQVFVMNADGSGQTQLTSNANYNEEPSWSPDGTKIAFVSRPGGEQPRIYVMNSDGSAQTRIMQTGSGGSPTWSPDGTKIAFVNGSGRTDQIYVMSADGSHQTRLTKSKRDEDAPAWSPDGTKIAFERKEPRTEAYQVFVMKANGSKPEQLTHNTAGVSTDSVDPAWSPDGTKIAFSSRVARGDHQIFVMSADGSNPTRITLQNPRSEADAHPAWQPVA